MMSRCPIIRFDRSTGELITNVKYTDFDRLLKEKDYIGASSMVLNSGMPLLAATEGLDGRPQVWPVMFAFEQDGAFYFPADKSTRLYAEISMKPHIQLCMYSQEDLFVVRLSGKVCFSEDETLITKVAAACPKALEKAGNDIKRLIVFFITGVEMILEIDGEEKRISLPDPEGILVGIKIKKNSELRDRLAKILVRRETDPPDLNSEASLLYDGALFVFAETAKSLWPRMDIQPLEWSAHFETYDDREKYTGLAAKIIGNAVIDKPEDLTYWLDPSRWAQGEFEA